MKSKRLKLYLDALFWVASAVKEIANSAGEMIMIWQKIRRKRKK